MIIGFLGKLLYTVLVFIQFILSLRFIFVLIGANADSAVVSIIYELSEYAVAPFRGIIASPAKVMGFTVDLDALIVIFVCMLAEYVTMEIVKIFSPRKES